MIRITVADIDIRELFADVMDYTKEKPTALLGLLSANGMTRDALECLVDVFVDCPPRGVMAGCSTCGETLTWSERVTSRHLVPSRQTGLKMVETHYCSPRCLSYAEILG